MTIRKALILILVSAFSAIVAFFVEFSCAALLSWVGFGWPVRMLLYPGENLYRYLLSQGFYPHSSKLFIDMIFALKFDLVLNFLLFDDLVQDLGFLKAILLTQRKSQKKRYNLATRFDQFQYRLRDSASSNSTTILANNGFFSKRMRSAERSSTT